MKYRGSIEIIDQILGSIGSGVTKTRIMYSAYLSYTQLTEYLSLLEQRDLIRLDGAEALYRITEKGLRFMSAFNEIKQLIPTADERNGKHREFTF